MPEITAYGHITLASGTNRIKLVFPKDPGASAETVVAQVKRVVGTMEEVIAPREPSPAPDFTSSPA